MNLIYVFFRRHVKSYHIEKPIWILYSYFEDKYSPDKVEEENILANIDFLFNHYKNWSLELLRDYKSEVYFHPTTGKDKCEKYNNPDKNCIP